jgi:hypothetical protein
VVNPLRDRSAEVLVQQRHVVAVVDRPWLERQLLAEQVEELGEGVDAGGDEVSLDPGDRCLRCTRAIGQLLLGQPVAPPGRTEELS